ncbi:MAG TPA: glycosyltransferase family 4 protein [Flavobacterium sp.]|jgi:glycosyltransferase involved in cell wall biosynthesis
MKILYITDQIYLHGGAEKILIQKLNYWADDFGYDVRLVTTQQKGLKPFFALSPKVELVDLEIEYTEGVSFYSPANFSRFPEHFRKLKNAINGFAPDAIFVISQTFSRFIAPAAAGKYPVYYEYHTSYYGFELGRRNASLAGRIKAAVLERIIRRVESAYTAVIYLNQWEFDHYKRKNSVVIPNFFDRIPDNSRPRKKRIITLGRLSFQKGYDLLIKAWAVADKDADGWQLDIYGNGHDRDALLQKIEAANFKNPLRLHAAIDNVNEMLSESEIYIMSSRFETFPMVLLEAMSNRLPVVAFDCPTGPRSMVTDGEDGILVAPEDINALAEKMVYLMHNDALRRNMGEKAFLNIQRFNPEVVMTQWDELVKQHLR